MTTNRRARGTYGWGIGKQPYQRWNDNIIEEFAKIARMNPDYLKELVRYLRDHLLIIIYL